MPAAPTRAELAPLWLCETVVGAHEGSQCAIGYLLPVASSMRKRSPSPILSHQVSCRMGKESAVVGPNLDAHPHLFLANAMNVLPRNS